MDIDRLAYLGAKARQQQIEEEAAELARFISDYERRQGRPRAAGRAAGNGAAAPSAVRRRKPMSAAQRKAVGERMRKYWAQRRKAEAKAPK